MFSSLKLSVLRPRSRSLSNTTTSCTSAESSSLFCKSSKTSVGSPKPRQSKKRNSDLIPCSTFNQVSTSSGSRSHYTNGMGTSMMRPEELSTLPHDPIDDAMLEIEYSLPEYGSQNSLSITTRVTEVKVERIDGSLGITLRGGLVPEHPSLSRPLVITQVRKNGPAHRTSLVRVGDRLLKVDHHSLVNKTLLEAQQILKESTQENRTGTTNLTIEYDVSVMESVRYATGPLLLEIERQCEEEFGLILSNGTDQEKEDLLGLGGGGLYIERVIPASTAERCGALCVGDRLLAIDDVTIPSHCVVEAQNMLRRACRLQILPVHASFRSSSRSTTRDIPQSQGLYGTSKSPANFSTWNSKRSQNNRNRLNRQSSILKSSDGDFGSSCCSYVNNLSGVSHPETLTVSVNFERGVGYGFAVAVGDHAENRPADILISWIATDSPAYRCGCLQVGDRILAVNYQTNLTLQEINSILELGNEQNGKITLQVEFDVADSVVPTSGIFTVKLAKRGPGLGITITASKTRPDEPFIISGLQRGSTAHRTGTLRPGDRLLAVDDRPLDRLRSADAAFDVFQRAISGDVVSLTVEKTGNGSLGNSTQMVEEEERVEYTVELRRKDGPLGVTIAGSEDCREPIVLSRLTEGGLAERTGALHVGDTILAINGESLEHKPLSEAIRLLQTSRDRVQLKIARNLKPNDGVGVDPRCSYSSPGLLSVDSAVDSWDSNTLDNPNDSSIDIKDGESILSDALSYQDHDKDFRCSTTTANMKKRDSQLQYYSDTDEMILFPSPLPLPCYNFNHNSLNSNRLPASGYNSKSNSAESVITWENEIYHVTLYKDAIYDDYGFSVSDGLYEKGVYVNRIRKGGPADIVGLLKPYDRIIQVNDVKTQDFDCCLTVPLIASAGDRIELIIARNPYINLTEKDLQQDNISKKSLSLCQNTIVKTL